jgi:uncharacterized protein YndB with AHSA1/START domain
MAEMLHEIQIEAFPDKVFKALTTEEGLKSWWTADTEAKPRVGGVAVFGFFNRSIVFKMRIDRLEPDKLIKWTCEGDWEEWIGTKLQFDLELGDGGTLVRFSHSGWRSTEGVFAKCNTTWGALMVRLKDYCEGKTPGPFFTY